LNEIAYIFFAWIHSVSAGIWLGGSLLYLIKSIKYSDKNINALDFISDYNSVLLVSSILLFLSGVIIAFDRLTYGNYSNTQMTLLLTKVLLTFLLLYLTWVSRNSIKEFKVNPSFFISIIIYLIASILSFI
jgi:putative copper export protein|tara:strand:+ start:187 stop:579 length:393 start_codon:yes stop_codon:yes gene_type:complete